MGFAVQVNLLEVAPGAAVAELTASVDGLPATSEFNIVADQLVHTETLPVDLGPDPKRWYEQFSWLAAGRYARWVRPVAKQPLKMGMDAAFARTLARGTPLAAGQQAQVFDAIAEARQMLRRAGGSVVRWNKRDRAHAARWLAPIEFSEDDDGDTGREVMVQAAPAEYAQARDEGAFDEDDAALRERVYRHVYAAMKLLNLLDADSFVQARQPYRDALLAVVPLDESHIIELHPGFWRARTGPRGGLVAVARGRNEWLPSRAACICHAVFDLLGLPPGARVAARSFDVAEWPDRDMADDTWQLEYWLDTMVAEPRRVRR